MIRTRKIIFGQFCFEENTAGINSVGPIPGLYDNSRRLGNQFLRLIAGTLGDHGMAVSLHLEVYSHSAVSEASLYNI